MSCGTLTRRNYSIPFTQFILISQNPQIKGLRNWGVKENILGGSIDATYPLPGRLVDNKSTPLTHFFPFWVGYSCVKNAYVFRISSHRINGTQAQQGYPHVTHNDIQQDVLKHGDHARNMKFSSRLIRLGVYNNSGDTASGMAFRDWASTTKKLKSEEYPDSGCSACQLAKK